MLVLVYGHRIDGVLVPFPHVCPGEGCAIERWLRQTQKRRWYEDLKKLEATS